MPLHPNVRRCTHIQVTGHRCGSPALQQQYFCYFHTRMIKGVETRVDSEIHPIALIENAEAIQAAIMHMIDAVLKGTIDNRRANIVLKALHIAVKNSRNVRFQIRPDDMVRKVPSYAQQYLTEHPELNPPQPHPHAAPNVEPADHDPMQNCDPERARQPEPKAPRPAHSGNGASGNSPHPPERTRQKTTANEPLTTRQSERWDEIKKDETKKDEIKKLEASIEGAMHGNWRDLRTVFNAVGLTPPQPPGRQSAALNRNGKDNVSSSGTKARSRA
jgi:hypothetical protein